MPLRPELLPRPQATTPVRCPSCGHPINRHPVEPSDICWDACGCLWTPNDIAWTLLYGDLSRPYASATPRRTLPW